MPIVVEKYKPEWREEFLKAKLFYESVLKGLDVQIEHVGSTSVEGLWAKPILDIDIIVKNDDISKSVIKRLEEKGYIHQGDLGVSGREAFKYDKDNPNINFMTHHLYVCLEGTENLENHLALRKHLRENPSAVKAYSDIKRKLAKAYPNDIDSYIDGKTDLIVSFLEAEGMKSDDLKRIIDINKKPLD